MESQIMLLPAEVQQLSESVSIEKRNEVQTVLNQVFNGVSKMREQLNSVEVKDENDKINMKLANTIRLGVRQVRLEAEKTFDAKRSEVQLQMLNFKTEDQLWLKAKQTMQILTKEIEENARWKEETRERYEVEQKKLKIQQRSFRLSKIAPEILSSDFENMNDDTFELFYAGIEKAYNDRIEAEKKAEEEKIAKEKAEAEERERIRLENERLKKEAEAKEKQIEEERKKAESERKAIEEKARKEREEREKQLAYERKQAEELAEKERLKNEKIQAEQKAKADAEKKILDDRLRKEQEAKKKLEAELQAKKDIEAKAKKDKEEAERKLAMASDKEKLLTWVNSLEIIGFDPSSLKSESLDIANDIFVKFEAFKNWARNQVNTLK